MLKLSWQSPTDAFQNNFVVGNVESIFRLWFHFKQAELLVPLDVMVTNLNGEAIAMYKGIGEAYCLCSDTHK